MFYFWIFILAFAISVVATLLVKRLAWKYRVLDMPRPDVQRKIHKEPKALLGGLAIITAFNIVATILYFTVDLVGDHIPLQSMMAIWVGSLILAIGGVIDDVKNLPPHKQFLFPLAAVIGVVVSGMGVPHITNPFGGRILLDGPVVAGVGMVSAAFVFLWMMGMIYTSKFLDGLDGLNSSIGFVASLTLFALSFTPQVSQPYTASLAIVLCGSILGFLIFNWHPAKIFLGESGSEFIGFILGILSIIAGGKVATAFLVMGIPILDVAWVILRRIYTGTSPFKADRLHLHFRLFDLGLSHGAVVAIFVAFSAIFGGTAILLQSFGKFISVLVLLAIMLLFGLTVVYLGRLKAARAKS